MLAYINWNASPEIIAIGPLHLRWYGLLFALSFLVGLFLVRKAYEEVKAPEEWLDKVFLYVVIGAVVGARFGHVVFYEWDYYSEHLSDIPKVWKGGLASHGGAIGILTALIIYSKVITKKSLYWTFDKIVPGIALAGCFIRLGNLMNSEILGKQTDVAWAFVFEKIDDVPRHAVQLYESIFYLFSFFVLYYFYWNKGKREQEGYMFGLFLILIWGGRFWLESYKSDLGGIQSYFGNVLSTGQLLSIPLILWGIYLVFRPYTKTA